MLFQELVADHVDCERGQLLEANEVAMNPKMKQKWVEALRSGKYEQGKGMLKTGDGNFCCLGVLADINGETWFQTEKVVDEDEGGKVTVPCFAFRDPTGAVHKDITPSGYCGVGVEDAQELAQMNDSGTPFGEIATYIEEML